MNNVKSLSIHKELDKLVELSYVVGVALVGRSGLLISSRLPRDIDDRKFCAMAATMFGAIETASSTLESSFVSSLTVKFSDFQLIIMGADEQTILVSLLNSNTNLGLFFIDIEEAIKNFRNILKK
ncbi:MAG: roadblock/LC7 domain-containing protein [Promethearchaeota archaeon]|jgi:predicted regulator of Ras-like GTPase activity (Roadblock/LC7/MglB family)